MIRLKNDYTIQSDGSCFILMKDTKKLSKEGKVIYSNEGYYSGLSNALEGYIRKIVAKNISENDLTLKEVRKIINELKYEIKEYDGNIND